MSSQDFVVLGKIVGAYGVKGWVRVHPFADDPAVWLKLPCWRMGLEAHSWAQWREVVPTDSRLSADSVLVQLAGVSARDEAEVLRGALLGVPRSELPPTAENEYYWGDLLGLSVVNLHGQSLGKVERLLATGGNDVLVVMADNEKERGKERLLPFVPAVVIDVDMLARVVRVAWELDW